MGLRVAHRGVSMEPAHLFEEMNDDAQVYGAKRSGLAEKRHTGLLNTVCVLLSAHFAIAYQTLTWAMVPFAPERALDGSGGPFAYRMLPVLLWKMLARLIGPLHARYPRLHFPLLNRPFESTNEWFVFLLSFGSMLGTLLVARRMMRAVDGRPAFEWMALAMGYMAYFDTMLVLNRNLYYPYDLLGLFFFTTLTYLAYRGRPLVFTLVLVVAMLNKETAIVAVLVYFGLQYGRKPMAQLLAQCTGMGLLGLGVRAGQRLEIHHVCPTCSGAMQNQVLENLHQMKNPLFWLSETAVFGFAWVAAVLVWRYVPRRMRWLAVAVYALWLGEMSVVGVLREVRVFSELSALLLLVIATGLREWLRTKNDGRAQPDPEWQDFTQERQRRTA